jgi:hypothetical protein
MKIPGGVSLGMELITIVRPVETKTLREQVEADKRLPDPKPEVVDAILNPKAGDAPKAD